MLEYVPVKEEGRRRRGRGGGERYRIKEEEMEGEGIKEEDGKEGGSKKLLSVEQDQE